MASAVQRKTKKPQAGTPDATPSLDGASSVFAAELAKDEKLLWQSRPGAGAYALAHLRSVFMGLTFFAAAFAWNGFVTRSAMMVELKLVAWLFGAVGVYYVAVPLWAYGKAKWFLFYALTNQRLLILQVFPKRKAKSFPIKTLTRVVRHNVHMGNGTLLIDAPGALSKNPIHPRGGFYGVKYVTKVVEAIETLQDPEAALKRLQAKQAQQLKQAQSLEAQSAGPQPSAAPARSFTPSSGA